MEVFIKVCYISLRHLYHVYCVAVPIIWNAQMTYLSFNLMSKLIVNCNDKINMPYRLWNEIHAMDSTWTLVKRFAS